MAQDLIKMARRNQSDDYLVAIKQPDEGLGYSFETTYTEDTTRVQSGLLNLKPMFTVEALKYKASNVSVSEMYHLLQFVATGEPFRLHYFSPYYGRWKTAPFSAASASFILDSVN